MSAERLILGMLVLFVLGVAALDLVAGVGAGAGVAAGWVGRDGVRRVR